jgi:hypothetical protein
VKLPPIAGSGRAITTRKSSVKVLNGPADIRRSGARVGRRSGVAVPPNRGRVLCVVLYPCATERRLGGVDRLGVSPIAASSQLYQATYVHGPTHAEAVRHQDSRIVRRPYGREEPSKRRSPEIVRHDASDLPNPPSLVRRLPELLDNGSCQQCCNDDQRDRSFGGSLGPIRHAAIVVAATSTCDPYCCRLGDAPEPSFWRGACCSTGMFCKAVLDRPNQLGRWRAREWVRRRIGCRRPGTSTTSTTFVSALATGVHVLSI